MYGDEIVPRRIPPQNILVKLRNREIGLHRRRGSPCLYANDLYKCVFPNTSVINVGRPRTYFRKFSLDGRYFIGFSIDQNFLEIFRYNGPCAAAKYFENAKSPFIVTGEGGDNYALTSVAERMKIFDLFFTLKHRVAIADSDHQVCRECCLFTNDNKYVIVASTCVVSDDRIPHHYETHRSNESPTSRLPFENVLIEAVEMDTGIVADRLEFKVDKVAVSHHAGLHIYDNTFAVLSMQHQTIHLYKITSMGQFVPWKKIGRFCFEDDELVLGIELPRHAYEEKCLGALKQRILAHLFRGSKTMDQKRRFAQKFDSLLNLRMWKVQFLDEDHLLIKYAAEEIVALRRMDAASPPVAAMPALLVIYQISEARVLSVHDNSSAEFLAVFEKYADYFYGSHLVPSRTVSLAARKLHKRWKQTLTGAKHGGVGEATKRLLAQLPVTPQAYAVSPYLDVDLFSFDEKYVSPLDRPRANSDAPLRFYSRDSGLLRFRVHVGIPKTSAGYVPSSAKKLVVFAFHPTDPFALSIQRAHVDYVAFFEAVMARVKQYLLWCINEFVDMRLPEIEALSAICGLRKTFVEPPSEEPWLIVECDDEERLRKFMSRSILVKFCLELWSEGASLEELHNKSKQPEVTRRIESYRHSSFKMVVDSFGKALSSREKLTKMNTFEFLPLEGKIDLKSPDLKMYLYEYYGMDPNDIPEQPYRLFFGKWVANGQRKSLSRFNLKERLYIGNTSMDPTLSFIMANLAKVKTGYLVFDPFCGTASTLLSAAEFGASVVGSDMDFLTLHARTKPTRVEGGKVEQRTPGRFRKREHNESIPGNFAQYDITSRFLDVVVADAAARKSAWRNGMKVDAIVTDPPYGIREGTKTIGARNEVAAGMTAEQLKRYIPTRVPYAISNIYADLLDQAAEMLVIGGRLVFWMPVIRESYTPEQVPCHPCLTLVANCEQILTSHSSRRLIVMEKTREPVDGDKACLFSELDDFTRKYFAGSNKTVE